MGAGAIGSSVCRAIARGEAGPVRVSAIAARPGSQSAHQLAAELGGITVVTDPVLLASMADIVVEAASQDAVRAYGVQLLDGGADLVVASVGALADPELRRALEAAAARSGTTVHLPSGAVGGLDALEAARLDRIDEVTLTTTKPPGGLGQPAARHGRATSASLLFEGSATRAAAELPANLNVAVLIGLASIGADRVHVRVVADPRATTNTHRIQARGAFGELDAVFRNLPSPGNPRTSYLAALSVIATLRRMSAPIRIG